MATRLNKLHQDSVRDKIKTSIHLSNLHKNAIGEMEMDQIQQRSAMYLIDQSIGKAPQKIEAEIKKAWALKL